jgi:hypothetical protein
MTRRGRCSQGSSSNGPIGTRPGSTWRSRRSTGNRPGTRPWRWNWRARSCRMPRRICGRAMWRAWCSSTWVNPRRHWPNSSWLPTRILRTLTRPTTQPSAWRSRATTHVHYRGSVAPWSLTPTCAAPITAPSRACSAWGVPRRRSRWRSTTSGWTPIRDRGWPSSSTRAWAPRGMSYSPARSRWPMGTESRCKRSRQSHRRPA